MDEQMIAKALKVQALKEMLGFYLLSLKTEEVDRTTLLKFAREFDKEEGTSLSPLLKIFKPADVETLLRLYREDATLAALQPAAPTVSATVQSKKAQGTKILRLHPTSAAPPALTAAPSAAAGNDDLPNWVRELKEDPQTELPPAHVVQPQTHRMPVPPAAPTFADDPSPPPIVDRVHPAQTASALSRLKVNRKTGILMGVFVGGLILVLGALLFAIDLQSGSTTTDTRGSNLTTQPANGQTQQATVPTPGPTAARPNASTNVQAVPPVEAVPTYTTWYQWYFQLTGTALQDYMSRCKISSQDEAHQRLNTLKANGWMASKTPQPPCQ